MTSQPAAPHEVVVPPLPFRVRPLGVRIAIIAVLAGLGAVCAVVWIGFGPQVRAQFTPFQISTLLVLGGLILASGHAVARSRVDVRADGLTVVNGYRTRELDWRDVTAVRMRPGAPWASLQRADGTVVALLGIQQTDGARAEVAVRRLRAVARAAHRGTP